MRFRLLVVAGVACVVLVSTAVVLAQGSKSQNAVYGQFNGFSYQGQLRRGNAPYNGTCSMQFSVWDSLSSLTGQQGLTFVSQPVTVTNGLFMVQTGFGAAYFDGSPRWLQVDVKCGADSVYTTLAPRQTLGAVPYAVYALGNWGLNGNSGTSANNLLGTIDNLTLTLSVSNTAVLRLVPDGSGFNAPGVIGGANNRVTNGAFGATIAGGGGVFPNTISGNWGAVGGGFGNEAGSEAAVAGGRESTASGVFATVPGGFRNVAQGKGSFAAGQFAKALDDGTFVWADDTLFNPEFKSGGANQFDVRATGGISLVTKVSGVFNDTIAAGVFIDRNGVVSAGGLNVNGTTFNRMESGTADAGNTFGLGVNTKVVTITFPVTFTAVPKVILTPRGADFNDTFVATTRRITTSYCVVNIVRVDQNHEWAQDLMLDWFASE
jgi:hypothetical protein